MSERIKIGLFVVTSFLFLSANIGGFSIYMLDEAKNSQCAREMWETGNYFFPTFNGSIRTDKPPLHYFFMMLSYSVFGFSPFSARLFSSIFGALTVMLTYFTAKRFLGIRTANFSVLILLSSLGFNAQFHMAVPDPYLVFFITASIVSFLFYNEIQKVKYLYLAYLSIGLGVLAKGPIAIAIPGIAMLFFLIFSGQFSLQGILNFRPLTGALVILLISSPWYIGAHIETNGEWTRDFFLDHNVNRFSSPKEGHGGSFFLTPLYAIIMLLPFSIFIIQALKKAFHDRNKNVLLISGTTVIFTIIFFSISSTKLPNYISPTLPFMSILIANFIANWDWYKPKKKSLLFTLLIYLVITIAFPIGAYFGLSEEKSLTELNHLAYYLLAVPVGGILAIVGWFVNNSKIIIGSMSASFLVTIIIFFFVAFPMIDRRNPVYQTKEHLKDAPDIIYYHRMNPAFVLKVNKEIKGYDDFYEIQKYLDTHKALVISRDNYVDELKRIGGMKHVATAEDMFDNTTTVIFKNY
ncbi:MAG TPA: ArnT family glycosyltransferase [Cyclobacteriaceae bacterium]